MKNRYSLNILLLLTFLLTFSEATESPENINSDKKITVTSKKKFSSNEALKFSIDTGSKKGFIYLVYIDTEGGTSLLYPQNNSTQEKKGGTLNFPEDFGKQEIKTSKDCKDCKEEKTTIFVLFSNDPVENIQNMNEEDLQNINTQGEKSRSILETTTDSNILINRIDFIVE